MKSGFCRETPGQSRQAAFADTPAVLERFLELVRQLLTQTLAAAELFDSGARHASACGT